MSADKITDPNFAAKAYTNSLNVGSKAGASLADDGGAKNLCGRGGDAGPVLTRPEQLGTGAGISDAHPHRGAEGRVGQGLGEVSLEPSPSRRWRVERKVREHLGGLRRSRQRDRQCGRW